MTTVDLTKNSTTPVYDLIWINYRRDDSNQTCPEFNTIQTINDKRERKHLGYQLHRYLGAFQYDMYRDEFEALLNKLTDNNFGEFANTDVNCRMLQQDFEHYSSLKRIFTFKNRKSGFRLVMVDQFESEQPGCTDGMPTCNPNYVEMGIVLSNDMVFKIY